MNNKMNKTLILNTLTLFLCVVIIALFCWTPKPKVDKVLETYKIVFDSTGGNYIEAIEIEEGGNVIKPSDPTRDGYEFVGWMLGDELYDFSQALSGNITLKAAWKELVPGVTYYTVYFDTAGANTIANQVIEEGQVATQPDNPTRNGYIFTGWTYQGDPFDFSTPITENMTLVANWEENTSVGEPNTGNEDEPATRKYTVRFNLNGGSGSIATQTVESGKTAKAPANPTRTGYKFNGWRLGSATGSIFNFNTPITSNITLYANWTAITYTVRFFDENGKIISSATQNVNAGAKAKVPSMSNKAFYIFNGFFNTQAASGGTNANNMNINASMDFYARYTAGSFTVTCVEIKNGNTNTNSCNVKINGGNAYLPSGACIKSADGDSCISNGTEMYDVAYTGNALFGSTARICESANSSNCVNASVNKTVLK